MKFSIKKRNPYKYGLVVAVLASVLSYLLGLPTPLNVMAGILLGLVIMLVLGAISWMAPELPGSDVPPIKTNWIRNLFNEKTVLILGAAVIVLMIVVPPFYIEIRGLTDNLGYSFILDPPSFGSWSGRIDALVLVAQCVGVGVVTRR